MRVGIVIQVAMLLSLSMDSLAARVEYQHPDVTIVAVEESLDSVLKAVGKEMQIAVTVPVGLDLTINCDIHNQPIERAFKNLLGDLSYSLTWEDGGERLLGVTILAGQRESAVATTSNSDSRATAVSQGAPSAVSQSYQGSPPHARSHHDPSRGDHDAVMAEHAAQMEVERAEQEARMAEQRAIHEAEMAQRRQEEEAAHEARMREEVARKEAETAAFVEKEFPRRP